MVSRNSLLNRILANTEKLKATLVYTVTFDLKGAEGSEYAKITQALENLGYTRDSDLGEKSLPKNFYAGQKEVLYSEEQDSLEEKIKSEKNDFYHAVTDAVNKEAPGKLDAIFVLVSDRKRTEIGIG